MSISGLNIRTQIWRNNNDVDDAVGGAMITGSLVYTNIPTRLEGNKPSQLLLQQGLETQRTFTATMIPGTMDIRERDELEVVAPFDHVYINKRFRIIGVLHSDFNPRDPRSYMILTLVRSVRAHGRQ